MGQRVDGRFAYHHALHRRVPAVGGVGHPDAVFGQGQQAFVVLVLLLDAGQPVLVVERKGRVVVRVLPGREDAALEGGAVERFVRDAAPVQVTAVGELPFNAQHLGNQPGAALLLGLPGRQLRIAPGQIAWAGRRGRGGVHPGRGGRAVEVLAQLLAHLAQIQAVAIPSPGFGKVDNGARVAVVAGVQIHLVALGLAGDDDVLIAADQVVPVAAAAFLFDGVALALGIVNQVNVALEAVKLGGVVFPGGCIHGGRGLEGVRPDSSHSLPAPGSRVPGRKAIRG